MVNLFGKVQGKSVHSCWFFLCQDFIIWTFFIKTVVSSMCFAFESHFSGQIMSKDKYPGIFLHKMKAIVWMYYISLIWLSVFCWFSCGMCQLCYYYQNSRKQHVFCFRESLLWTDNVHGQISWHIFAQNEGYCLNVLYFLNLTVCFLLIQLWYVSVVLSQDLLLLWLQQLKHLLLICCKLLRTLKVIIFNVLNF